MTETLLHFPNPLAADGQPYPRSLDALFAAGSAAAAYGVITAWPGYRTTPLSPRSSLALELGVGEIWCKDESDRFGMGSFKALGGSYAVYRLLERHIHAHFPGAEIDAALLMQGGSRELVSQVRVAAASAGNHGKAVAWGARMFGCGCTIYVPVGTSSARVAAINDLGAEAVRIKGTYDDAVRRVAEDPDARGWHVIWDTSSVGYTGVWLTVMQGYTVLAEEFVQQWRSTSPPTHVFLQCGVGGLAAAIGAHLRRAWGADRPRTIVLEPEAAAYMLRTAQAGKLSPAAGPLRTVMTCLDCAEASPVSRQILRQGADDFLAISDGYSAEATALLERPCARGSPIRTAPSGAAGLVALLAVARDPAAGPALGLGQDSRVLLIVSERAQD